MWDRIGHVWESLTSQWNQACFWILKLKFYVIIYLGMFVEPDLFLSLSYIIWLITKSWRLICIQTDTWKMSCMWAWFFPMQEFGKNENNVNMTMQNLIQFWNTDTLYWYLLLHCTGTSYYIVLVPPNTLYWYLNDNDGNVVEFKSTFVTNNPNVCYHWLSVVIIW